MGREPASEVVVTPARRLVEAVAVDDRVAEQIADTMFALSTPSRVQILACLTVGPLSVGDLMATLAMEQSAVSHQLRVLREHALVSVVKVGRRRVYALHDEHVEVLLDTALQQIADRRRRTRSPRRAASGTAEA